MKSDENLVQEVNQKIKLSTDLDGAFLALVILISVFIGFGGFSAIANQWSAAQAGTNICHQYSMKESSFEGAVTKFKDCIKQVQEK